MYVTGWWAPVWRQYSKIHRSTAEVDEKSRHSLCQL